ncbi:hypothetical protein HYV86_01765 [Candidatus Woesearchaeota archaeon]|nr:hypothetical protein [Candidatus Woesearchaeota archaeon]
MDLASQLVYDFGQRRADLIPVLEIVAGGLGPYKDPRVIFDCASSHNHLPKTYTNADIDRARSRLISLRDEKDTSASAALTLEVQDLQRAVWERYHPLERIAELQEMSARITDDALRLTRVDEARSLELFAKVYGAKLGIPNITSPSYQECVLGVTGLSQDPTPSITEMDQMRDRIEARLNNLGYHSGTFSQKVAAFRNQIEPLNGAQAYLTKYREVAAALIEHIKNIDPHFPREADVKIVTPEAANEGTGGSFDYGRGNGAFQAESFIVPHEHGTLVDLLITTAHEIGGHFRLMVLWNQYANRTNDHLGHIGAMRTNQTCTQEGMADQGISFYREFASEFVDSRLIDIELDLYLLNRATLGYQIAKHFSSQPQTQEEIITQGIEYGMLIDAITNRSRGIVSGRRDESLKLYGGPAYHPGLQRVSKLAARHGADKVWQAARQPLSLGALEHILNH